MSPLGPSRHFDAAQESGRFQVKADNKWQAGPAGSVENDPEATSPERRTGQTRYVPEFRTFGPDQASETVPGPACLDKNSVRTPLRLMYQLLITPNFGSSFHADVQFINVNLVEATNRFSHF
jgi:hypothetical protein